MTIKAFYSILFHWKGKDMECDRPFVMVVVAFWSFCCMCYIIVWLEQTFLSKKKKVKINKNIHNYYIIYIPLKKKCSAFLYSVNTSTQPVFLGRQQNVFFFCFFFNTSTNKKLVQEWLFLFSTTVIITRTNVSFRNMAFRRNSEIQSNINWIKRFSFIIHKKSELLANFFGMIDYYLIKEDVDYCPITAHSKVFYSLHN